MRKPLIHSLLLALFFVSGACGDAKFNGKGKKKKQADVVVDPPQPCKPGETCVVDPECKPGEANCPTPVPTPIPTTTPIPPKDDCKDGGKECPVPPKDDCKDGGKNCPVPPKDDCDNAGQNPGQNHGKDCPSQNDDAGQNDPVQQH